MPRISDKAIKTMQAEAVAGGRVLEVGDDGCKGLRVRASYGGAVSFFLLYKPRGEAKSRRLLIGKFPMIGIAEARRRAQTELGKIADGGDPVGDKKAAIAEAERKSAEAEAAAREIADRMTVREVAERFLHAKADLRWAKRYRQMLSFNLLEPSLPELQLGVAEKAVEDLTERDLDDILTAIANRGSPIQARRVYEVLRAMIRWARKKHYIEHDPISGVTVPANSKPRDRVLSVVELRAFWNDLCAWDAAGARGEDIPVPINVVRSLRLQLLLAQRSGEVTGMRKFELSKDGYEWTIPGERTKNGETHVVPLPPLARTIIAAAVEASDHPAFVFPVHARDGSGWASSRSDVQSTFVASVQEHFAFVDREGRPAPFVAHDLRRTASTCMRKLGISTDIVGHVLNHKSEKGSSVTSRHYDHAEQEFSKREALTRWQATLQDIAEGIDPFARSAKDIEEMEARTIQRTRGARLVAIDGGRS